MKKVVLCVVGFLSCTPSKPKLPIPGMVELTQWQESLLTFCCQRENGGPDCATSDWTRMIQDHCRGKSSLVRKDSADCATYQCSEWIKAYDTPGCSPIIPRQVRVKVFVDPKVKELPAWESLIHDAFTTANWYFDPVKISFKIASINETNLMKGDNLKAPFKFLKSHRLDSDADIFLGIVSTRIVEKRGWKDVEHWGEATFLDDQLVLNIRTREILGRVLGHELGHIFGATHVDDEKSVMNYLFKDIQNISFDPASKAMIRVSKCADLKKGPEGISTATFHQLGEIYRTNHPPEQLNPIGLALWDHSDFAKDKGDYSKAISLLEQAVVMQPNHPWWKILTAEAKLNADKYDEALKDLNEAESLQKTITKIYDPDWPNGEKIDLAALIAADRGDVYFFKGEFEAAKREYDKALQIESKQAEALIGLGYLSLKDNNNKMAQEYFEKALSINPKSERAQKGLKISKGQ